LTLGEAADLSGNGKVLASQNDRQMFDPGSTMELYSSGDDFFAEYLS
jgi:hypothetical protein